MPGRQPVLGIACGIFTGEINALAEQGAFEFPFVFLDSALHMRPDVLKSSLNQVIEDYLLQYERVLLVYGDCHPYMQDLYDPKRVVRVQGINCIDIMLGRERYKSLRKEGAFFVLEEWAYRWKEIFVDQMGLSEKNAPIFMKSMHEKIHYLDTGISPIPYTELEEMSKYFDLPYQITSVTLDFLKDAILKAYEGVKN